MPTITTQDWGSYYAPPGSAYWALNNAWNNPGAGTQWIDYNTSTFPNGTTINWNYGSHIAPSNVWGYPEIVYGTQNTSFDPPNGTHPANWGEQIGTLGHFNMTWDFSLTGNLNQYDVLAETHLSGHEFGIILNSPDYMTNFISGFTQYHFNLGGVEGEAIPNFWGSGTLGIIPDSVENGTPMTHGSIDFAPIISWAISEGWLSSSDQLKGFELGIEAQQGAGSMTVNSLNYDWGPGSSPTNPPPAGENPPPPADNTPPPPADNTPPPADNTPPPPVDNSPPPPADNPPPPPVDNSPPPPADNPPPPPVDNSPPPPADNPPPPPVDNSPPPPADNPPPPPVDNSPPPPADNPPPENLVLRGGSGSDHLTGGDGSDQLFGARGNDVLAGNAGNDILSGDRGQDILMGGQGNDTINGNSGRDYLLLDGARQDYTFAVTRQGVTITDSSGDVDTVKNVEVFDFSDGTNYLVGKHGLVQTSDQTINQFLANSGLDQSHLGPVPTAGVQQQPVQTATPTSPGTSPHNHGSFAGFDANNQLFGQALTGHTQGAEKLLGNMALWNAVDAVSNNPTHADSALADLTQQLHDGFDHAGATGSADELAALLPWTHDAWTHHA